MNIFDKIVKAATSGELGSDMLIPNAAVIHSGPDGRSIEWKIEDIVGENIDPDFIRDTLLEIEVESEELLHLAEEEDVWTNHEIVIGCIDLENPETSWALAIHGTQMDDANFESEASFHLLEGKAAIDNKINSIKHADLEAKASDLIQTIRAMTGGSPKKLLTLKQAIRDNGGSDLLDVWDAQVLGETFENRTQPASERKPKPGRL